MRYVECPEDLSDDAHAGRSLFLAGGVTGCPDWQSEVAAMSSDLDIVLLNPRRRSFPILDPSASEAQICWEHRHLRAASGVLFWFPRESVCPIALYELGAWSMTAKTLFVGVHPEYERRADVEIQTRLARPDVHVAYALKDLVKSVRSWITKTAPDST